ncbi:MAG: DUF1015 family protein [Firmicutes bacterium]|jgi:uncharacterized protein (DUF1015 family)|nr:DUF1015 family protein [Bacillota bacterium]
MAIVRPFKGIRPDKNLVDKIASLPYDVMNREEARKMAEGNDDSFLHVVRSDIDFSDEVSQYDEKVYDKARINLDDFIDKKKMLQDGKPIYYIYRQIMFGRVQTGLVACTSIDEYINGTIKKHEFTRPEKEEDRINNFDRCDANTAPIFMTYKKNDKITKMINDWIKFNKPVYDFKSEDEITHIVWTIDNESVVEELQSLFFNVDYLYIADGHHRTASSVKVGLKRREENPDYKESDEFNYFMSVIFPDEDLFIMDYNRVVKDLNGNNVEEFMTKVKEKFEVEKSNGDSPYRPLEKHSFGMYLEGSWYSLKAKKGSFDPKDPVDRLDVSILQNNLLSNILDIKDPRTDKRIDFIGGIRGLEELERRVENGMAVAFSMYPTTMDDLIDIADAGEVMPPKSTWFEPKLRSGLFVHRLK